MFSRVNEHAHEVGWAGAYSYSRYPIDHAHDGCIDVRGRRRRKDGGTLRHCASLVYVLSVLFTFLVLLRYIHVFKFLESFYGKGARVSYNAVI